MTTRKNSNIANLEKILEYSFNNHKIINQALTHKSAIDETTGAADYQRLEFVGDAVLDLFIAEQLYKRYPKADEGMLTQWRANLVNRDYLAKLAKKIKINRYLKADKSQKNIKDNENVLADVIEAVFAAIFFDGGFEALRISLEKLYQEPLDNIHSMVKLKDIKSKLQEYLQQRKWPLPIYEDIMQIGPKHRPIFVVQVKIPSFHSKKELPIYSIFGEGDNKKSAERNAASKALHYLQTVDIDIE